MKWYGIIVLLVGNLMVSDVEAARCGRNKEKEDVWARLVQNVMSSSVANIFSPFFFSLVVPQFNAWGQSTIKMLFPLLAVNRIGSVQAYEAISVEEKKESAPVFEGSGSSGPKDRQFKEEETCSDRSLCEDEEGEGYSISDQEAKKLEIYYRSLLHYPNLSDVNQKASKNYVNPQPSECPSFLEFAAQQMNALKKSEDHNSSSFSGTASRKLSPKIVIINRDLTKK